MRTTLESILPRGQNGFDVVRLAAAMLVIFAHSFVLFPGGYADPLVAVLGVDGGTLGVAIFFFLSGILVTASFVRSKSLPRFALARIGRIWPGFVAVLLIAQYVIGPAVTAVPMSEYLSVERLYPYLGTNWTLATGINDALPGVFAGNHKPGAVNGSLWTLLAEVRCYLGLALVGVLGGLSRRWLTNAAAAGIVALYFLAPQAIPFFGDMPDHARNGGLFLLGVVAFANRHALVIGWRWMAAAAGLALAGNLVLGLTSPTLAAFCYLALCVSAAPAVRKIRLPGDYSYGIYLYGFLIQQMVNYLLPGLTVYWGMALSMAVALAFGAASWYAIEKPFMSITRWVSDRIPSRVAANPA